MVGFRMWRGCAFQSLHAFHFYANRSPVNHQPVAKKDITESLVRIHHHPLLRLLHWSFYPVQKLKAQGRQEKPSVLSNSLGSFTKSKRPVIFIHLHIHIHTIL